MGSTAALPRVGQFRVLGLSRQWPCAICMSRCRMNMCFMRVVPLCIRFPPRNPRPRNAALTDSPSRAPSTTMPLAVNPTRALIETEIRDESKLDHPRCQRRAARCGPRSLVPVGGGAVRAGLAVARRSPPARQDGPQVRDVLPAGGAGAGAEPAGGAA